MRPEAARTVSRTLLMRRSLTRLVLFTVLLGAASSLHWLDALRAPPLAERTAVEFRVTSANDTGPGSLREALFDAARAQERPRILITVPRVEVSTPLPPAVHPRGMVIESPHGAILVSHVASPTLEIRADHTVLRAVTVRAAAGSAVAVYAQDVLLEHVAIEDSAIGLEVIARPSRISVRSAHFLRNRIGVQLEEGASEGSIVDSRFEDNSECALWAVWPAVDPLPSGGTFQVVGSTVRGGQDGVVIANAPLAIERNDFTASTHTAISLLGGNVVVHGNRIRDTRYAAVLADSTARSLIADNEIHHNLGMGLSIRTAAGTRIEGNRIYDNGYGLVVVYGRSEAPLTISDNLISGQKQDGVTLIGASPVLRGNRVLSNGGVGLKVLDIVSAHSARVAAHPLLDVNVISGNASDHIVRGEYAL